MSLAALDQAKVAASGGEGVGELLVSLLYILVGIYALATAWQALRDPGHRAPVGTACFWGIFGLLMIFGGLVPPWLVGALLVVLALLTASRQVRSGTDTSPGPAARVEEAGRLGGRLFVPALVLGLVAFGVAQAGPSLTGLTGKQAGLIGLGAGGLVSLSLALLITGTRPANTAIDGGRLLQQMGSATLLPLVLAALGAVFKAAGMGEVIAGGVRLVIPSGSPLAGVMAYCLGMALFTVIMGNAFAAFLVITAGIGVPFVIAQGGDPAVTAAMGMTAGYCGTLMTPMAANFNIIPVAVLETRSRYRVIRSQLPMGLSLLVLHIVLMYLLAF